MLAELGLITTFLAFVAALYAIEAEITLNLSTVLAAIANGDSNPRGQR